LIAYLAQTSSIKIRNVLENTNKEFSGEYVFGEMAQRGQVPPMRHPWALDNGAYTDWREEKPFDADKFMHSVEWVSTHDDKPDFIALPDFVGNREDTITSTLRWGPKLAGVAPLYSVLQDGMNENDVRELATNKWLDGFFIGGTMMWKLKAGRWIVPLVHEIGLPCHVGRIGTNKKIRWAKRLYVDSIDTAGPLWGMHKLEVFIKAVTCPLEEQRQTDDYWWL